MIVFKTLKFKHSRRAGELQKAYRNEDADIEDVVTFASSLVAKWDFLDVETGEELHPGELDELSDPQVEELMEEFAKVFKKTEPVPKVNAEPSPSILMPLTPAESQLPLPPIG